MTMVTFLTILLTKHSYILIDMPLLKYLQSGFIVSLLLFVVWKWYPARWAVLLLDLVVAIRICYHGFCACVQWTACPFSDLSEACIFQPHVDLVTEAECVCEMWWGLSLVVCCFNDRIMRGWVIFESSCISKGFTKTQNIDHSVSKSWNIFSKWPTLLLLGFFF